MTLPVPAVAPSHFSGRHGEMWQWLGDGRELISLSLAVRETRLGTPQGVADHLSWEIDRIRKQLDAGADSRVHAGVDVRVRGAVGSAAADVDGTQRSLEVRNRLVVTTDGAHMHLVQVMVRDHEAGRELASEISSGLVVEPWNLPG
ncbi:hypothetical protein ncot_06830 [Nocardioides sp. JQ2195]|uniref:hypothetical protein n=1 Tax=Nocardioides sp. JQ2195 TaxID=2592334 RepID=UPI00143E8834|nr:hypothetical protein [Nocardioides sp. JQ2195]QIX26346.1 hypothetical protein ncot_06830 [Nocardioides sp. JQ2195]